VIDGLSTLFLVPLVRLIGQSHIPAGLARLENVDLFDVDIHFYLVVYLKLGMWINAGNKFLSGRVSQVNVCSCTDRLDDVDRCGMALSVSRDIDAANILGLTPSTICLP
jgi:hypothetical protein